MPDPIYFQWPALVNKYFDPYCITQERKLQRIVMYSNNLMSTLLEKVSGIKKVPIPFGIKVI